MMEFWPENQGQSHLYSRFGTVPGRNCTHNYHDRHQAAHYPLYYGEQQDHSRESSYWTVPGSRTGGALHEYSSWTDPELTASSSSSHFPFILDRHTQHHQDLGHYQPHESRDREWTTAQRASRDYERGFLREGWQRRWEPCSPVHYKREVSAKRSDSSYRELEAWAARYSHSLPRRRCIEAELKGTSQGLVGSSRAPEKDSRSGTDAQVAALQHVRQSANIREPGLWDRGSRQQATNYYPPQAPAPDTSHMLDTKENTGYQRRIFSQPPGYIAPPPYDSPHKSSPAMHQSNFNWEQDGKGQAFWSKPVLKNQLADLKEKRKEKDEFTKPDESKTCTQLEVLKHQIQEADAQCKRMSSVPPQEVQTSKIIKETSSQVIEGRKFRLNKKTGGMTIFCLVSRIAAATESPSLPPFPSQTDIQSKETGEVSKAVRDANEMNKLADEVDFRASTLTEQPSDSHVEQKEAPTCTGKEMLGDVLLNKAGTDDVDSTGGKQLGQSEQPASVKYPLWREPSFSSRTESSSTGCLKLNSEEEEADGVQNRHDRGNVSSHPIDIEVRRLDIKEDTEDSEGLLVIDTTCVVVKMELIPSPKKEHVHYFDSTAHDKDCPFNVQTDVSSEVNYQLNQDLTTDQKAQADPMQRNESPDTNVSSTLLEKEEHKGESEISFTCMLPSPIPERETLEERAERILGIPLHDTITEQQPRDETPFHDSCAEEQDEEPSPMKEDIHNENKQIPEDTTEKQNPLEVEDAVLLEASEDTTDQTNESVQDYAGSPEQVSDMPEENDTDSQLEKHIETSIETETLMLESAGQEGTRSEQCQKENQPVVDDRSCHRSDFSDSSLPSPSDLTSPLNSSESNTDDSALNTAAYIAPHPETSPLPPSALPQLPSPLVPDSFQSSTPHIDHSPSPPPSPLDLTDQTAEAKSTEDEESETSHRTEYEVDTESLVPDTTEEVASQQQHEPNDDEQMEQKLETSTEQDIEVNILQQQLECVQEQGAVCVKESSIAEEQPPEEISEDPAGLSVQTFEIDEENVSQVEANFVQQQSDCGQEEDVSEDRALKNPDWLPAGFWEHTMSKANATDLQMEMKMLHDTEPSASDCEVSSLDGHSLLELPSPPQESPESDIQFVSLVDSVCPSPLNPEAAADVQQTASAPLHFDSLQFSSLSDSSPVLPPSSAPDFLPSLKEELQYPKSLWDVVNRIRKHTAPDSENEEEEMSELWDPESTGEDFGCPDEEMVFDEAEQQEVKLMYHKELSGHADEDTLSCSSTSSHGSEDTVIVADEDEVEEMTLNVMTESKTDNENEEFNAVKEESCCSGDVKDETVAEEEKD
ncbi:uncharacterized protein si:ch211-159e12.5 [Acanthochromis polyacanthus]|uniref:uncharacterized protein si:ch211-159e12.5 n=1 Tax=Acanthochromis polyacanthus TaxID=80966 RepID=UPI002234774B|nr:uncharacterized protein si:ch211-159e12.5 [Acanthochromis polyacanthus]